MWLKLLISALVVLFCTALGYFLAGKYRARHKFYRQWSAFNERYLNELSFERKPLAEFLKKYDYTGDFEKTIQTCLEERTQEIKLSYLTKEELGACFDYFQMVGKGDSASQKSYFSAQAKVINEKRAEGERQAKSHSALYLKLGLLLGLAIVILIV